MRGSIKINRFRLYSSLPSPPPTPLVYHIIPYRTVQYQRTQRNQCRIKIQMPKPWSCVCLLVRLPLPPFRSGSFYSFFVSILLLLLICYAMQCYASFCVRVCACFCFCFRLSWKRKSNRLALSSCSACSSNSIICSIVRGRCGDDCSCSP